ncbi:MAG: TonB-dependent receptor [Tannerellaceae bacterium]|jgi:TonB-linked SusC/RagA family outer membrane protein|nr:TonB-dependent receptor [Tannerellaceae bacterium]
MEGRNILLMKRSELPDKKQTTRRITGQVTDTNGEAIIGANIVVKGTTNGTVSDIDGNFELMNVSDNAILEISYIGYTSQSIPVANRMTMNVQMQEDAIGLNEVIAIGYGVQHIKEITGAVSKVKSETLNRIASSDFSQGLQGQIAGMSISSSSGAPGATANIQIRGAGSFSADAINPLFVVDGIPFDQIPHFSSDEIESIEVLKDAASASIYGTRASNGVILITTKQGIAGQMKVSLNTYYGITKVFKNIPLINNTVDWLYVNRIRYMAVGTDLGWTALDDNPRGLHNNTNWMDLFQEDNAPMQNYSIRLSGGTNNLIYNLVTSYFNQSGLWINSGYERLSTRANTQFTNKKFTTNIGMSFNLSTQDINNPSLPFDAIRLRPFKAPVYYANERIPAPGSNSAAVANIVRRLKEINEIRENNAVLNMDLNYEVFQGFKLRANIGGSIVNRYNKLYNPSFVLYDEATGVEVSGSYPIASLTNTQNYRHQWITEFMSMYDKSWGEHKISLLAGFSMESQTRETFQAGKRSFLSNDIQVLSGGSIDPTASGTKYTTTTIGSIGRLQYNYANRYLLNTSIRRDGSSKFGKNYKYGIFPSVSVGWYVSEEPFYRKFPISSVLTNAKLRASIGSTGNQFIPDYSYVGVVASGNDYVLGPSDQHLELGVIQTDFANINVKWETSVSKNLGVDISLLEGKFSFTGDLYYTNKNDMLFPVSIPPSAGTGGGTINMNVGDMINKGLELSSTYRKTKGLFNFSLTGVFMSNVNRVTKTNLSSSTIYGGNAETDNTTVIKEGYPIGAFFLIPNDGLIDTQEELAEYRKLVPGAIMGDLKYIDSDKDGVITDDDRVYQGSGTPKWEGGLTFGGNYKNFDFNVQIFGAYGNKIYNALKRNSYAHKRHRDVLNAWTYANPNTTIPVPQGNLQHDNYRARLNYFLEDGSYLRIRNVQVGYNTPKALLSKIYIDQCRVYLSVDNVFTFTRYTGNDPEVGGDGLLSRGVDNGNIPVTSLFRLGLQLDF